MSTFSLSLRLMGELESLEAIAALVDGLPYVLRHKGERIGSKRIQPVNVLSIDLAEWEDPGIYEGDDCDAILAEERAKLAAATATLQRLAPSLASLPRPEITASLYLSTIQEEEQGGFGFPPDLVAAAAECGLAIDVSVLVLLDDDEEQPDAPIST